MTPIQVATLLLRLAALAWALIAFNHTYTIFAQWSTAPYSSVSIPGYWFYIVLHSGICALLWFFPASIARKLVPSLAAEPISPPAPPAPHSQWLAVGVLFIGLWVLTRALPDLIYWIVKEMMARAYRIDSTDMLDRAGLLATVVELAIGLYMVLGAQGLTGLLFRMRNVGTRERGPVDRSGQP